MKLSDAQRKAMFARLDDHVKEQNYDGLKRWYQDNEIIYGKDNAEARLYRKFQTRDRKIKEHGSVEAWQKDRQDKRSASYDKASRNARIKRNEIRDKNIIAKYGSKENEMKHYLEKERKELEKIKQVKENPKLAKANRDYALTGSKYYKMQSGQGIDSIHCPNCSQRLGNSISSCPVCGDQAIRAIYGKMLKDPSDKRWLDPRYQQNKFRKFDWNPYSGHHQVPSYAEKQLKDRQNDAGNLDDLR